MPLSLIERGLAVFPLPAGGKVAPAGWHATVTRDPAAAARWPAGTNIGVGCRASRVVGLDLDRKDQVDGEASLRAVCAHARAMWPDTLTVATAHGGLHLYFWLPAGLEVPSSIGRWPGVDVRAPGLRLGGYLVGPGSRVDGHAYEITRDRPIVPLPLWLATRLRRGFTNSEP
jgi:hypothetical protein